MNEKIIKLKPTHKSQFWWYLLGIILIPVFGIGIYLIYRTYSENNSRVYKISDRHITVQDSKYSERIDLISIKDIAVEERWIDRRFGIGNLALITETRSVEMFGLDRPNELSSMILKAAEAERIRLEKAKTETQTQVQSSPGTMDKMDYLTGLWQQGLITNEEFEEERKHFES